MSFFYLTTLIFISTVGQAEGLSVNGRIPAKHQYTCTKGSQSDYFLPRDAAQKNFLLKGMACHIVKPGSEKIAAIEKVVYEYFDT